MKDSEPLKNEPEKRSSEGVIESTLKKFNYLYFYDFKNLLLLKANALSSEIEKISVWEEFGDDSYMKV